MAQVAGNFKSSSNSGNRYIAEVAEGIKLLLERSVALGAFFIAELKMSIILHKQIF